MSSRARVALLAAGAAALVALPSLRDMLREPGAVHVATGCDIGAGPCTVSVAGQPVTLEVTPRGMPTTAPLTFRLTSSAPDFQATTLSIEGATMDMGLTRLPIQPDGAGWQTQGYLPVCTTRDMLWQLDFDVTVSGEAATLRFHNAADAPPAAVEEEARAEATYPPFTVQGAEGPLSLEALRGQVVVVYFGYLSCPDICPTTMASLGRALDALPPEVTAQVTGVFVSVDPERDTPERLEQYAQHFHARLHGGTDTPARIAEIARGWGIRYARVVDPGSAMAYTVDHTTHAVLVGTDGMVLRELPHGMAHEALAEAIRAAVEDGRGTQG